MFRQLAQQNDRSNAIRMSAPAGNACSHCAHCVRLGRLLESVAAATLGSHHMGSEYGEGVCVSADDVASECVDVLDGRLWSVLRSERSTMVRVKMLVFIIRAGVFIPGWAE